MAAPRRMERWTVRNYRYSGETAIEKQLLKTMGLQDFKGLTTNIA
jgi:hypothetical protein